MDECRPPPSRLYLRVNSLLRYIKDFVAHMTIFYFTSFFIVNNLYFMQKHRNYTLVNVTNLLEGKFLFILLTLALDTNGEFFLNLSPHIVFYAFIDIVLKRRFD